MAKFKNDFDLQNLYRPPSLDDIFDELAFQEIYLFSDEIIRGKRQLQDDNNYIIKE